MFSLGILITLASVFIICMSWEVALIGIALGIFLIMQSDNVIENFDN